MAESRQSGMSAVLDSLFDDSDTSSDDDAQPTACVAPQAPPRRYTADEMQAKYDAQPTACVAPQAPPRRSTGAEMLAKYDAR